MIRQQPLTTEDEFDEIIMNINSQINGETLYIQWHPDICKKNHNWPIVELLENFLWIHTNPNDSWWYIKEGYARAWKMFPNIEERQIPWNNASLA